MPKPSNGSDELIDTLALSEEQWSKLSERLDRVDAYQTGQRVHHRVSYRKLAKIAVAIQQPNGNWAKYVVRSRDLSTGGFGFIHGAYVHTDSKCRLIIKNRDGKVVCLEGTVRHCDYLIGTAHDVGVQFDSPIDIKDFTDIAPDDSMATTGGGEVAERPGTVEASADAQTSRTADPHTSAGGKRAAG